MKNVILYTTDFNHTNGSKVVIGVYTNRNKLIRDVKKIITKDLSADTELSKSELKKSIDWQLEFFLEKKQTQGLQNFELVAEEINLNEVNDSELI